MMVLVAGASGATGRRLVQQLLDRGEGVKAIVRIPENVPVALREHERVEVIRGNVLAMDDGELEAHVRECDAVASCLGHNLSLRGVFGPPHHLVTDSLRRLCHAIREQKKSAPMRLVLMSSSGVRNRDLDEPISRGQQLVLQLLRMFIPPHHDNEMAADYLRLHVGQGDPEIEWVAVRPDGLIDENEVSAYELHPSPIRSAIFDAGKISRINVGHFMAELLTDEDTWKTWNGRMPVIYSVSK